MQDLQTTEMEYCNNCMGQKRNLKLIYLDIYQVSAQEYAS